MSNATTYWKIQGHTPPPKPTGFAGMSKPYQQGWPCLEMTPADMKFGAKQLALVREAGKTAPDQDFGHMEVGYAAEPVVDRWLTSHGIPHTWNHDPLDPLPDYLINGLRVDLKTHSTAGMPKDHYDTNLTEEQRKKSGKRDWYLFAKLDRSNMIDLWVLGFQTLPVIMEKGVYYRKGEITRQKMDAKVNCWCIAYEELIKPLKWLGEHSEKKEP